MSEPFDPSALGPREEITRDLLQELASAADEEQVELPSIVVEPARVVAEPLVELAGDELLDQGADERRVSL